jgi:hypothetical protein
LGVKVSLIAFEVFPDWEDPNNTLVQTLIWVLGGILLSLLVAWWAVSRVRAGVNTRRREGLKRVASELGLRYSPEPVMPNWLPYRQADVASVRDMIYGEWKGQDVQIFNVSVGSGIRSRTTYSCSMVRLACAFPDVLVAPRTSLFGAATDGLRPVKTESAVFNRRYRVRSNEPEGWRHVLTPPVIRVMVDHRWNGWHVRVAGSYVAIYGLRLREQDLHQTLSPRDVRPMLDALMQLTARLQSSGTSDDRDG